MQRHSRNAMALAEHLLTNRKIERVYYPGLKTSPDHALAKKQMHGGFSGLLSFEIEGGQGPALAFLEKL